MTNEFQVLYKSRIADLITKPDTIKMYSKSSCRHCYGRGVIHGVTAPIKDRETKKISAPTEYIKLCDCVYKKVKKEIEESLKDG